MGGLYGRGEREGERAVGSQWLVGGWRGRKGRRLGYGGSEAGRGWVCVSVCLVWLSVCVSGEWEWEWKVG